MPRSEINRSGEMEVFARVVELGGFSPAARALRMTPSAVSKLITRLEARLGVRLIVRSTRKFMLTEEGTTFHERTLRVLADLDEAERAVAACQIPRGRLRINTNVPFGRHYLLPLVPRFTALHPGVTREQVIAATGWAVRFADQLGTSAEPSEIELNALRDLEARTAAAHGQTPGEA